ncbi:hypothetical protein CMUS01_10153 [Colletotrichum musicola]|uniref:Uncharacterized protein n=1 Tax=Colletotrichum musicola TaxID=2175873 RepID=A0A8H6N9Q9_9PEZI|nr:hypothetical protein CMUS01_10153 [Colletotrichum musicola]
MTEVRTARGQPTAPLPSPQLPNHGRRFPHVLGPVPPCGLVRERPSLPPSSSSSSIFLFHPGLPNIFSTTVLRPSAPNVPRRGTKYKTRSLRQAAKNSSASQLAPPVCGIECHFLLLLGHLSTPRLLTGSSSDLALRGPLQYFPDPARCPVPVARQSRPLPLRFIPRAAFSPRVHRFLAFRTGEGAANVFYELCFCPVLSGRETWTM